MLKRSTKRKHKAIKVLHFQNIKIGHNKVSKTEECINVIEEETLEKYINGRDLLELKVIYNISLSICETIANLISLNYNVICSQLDPSNILVTKNDKIIIKDFGFTNGNLINDNTISYLPNYVSAHINQQSIQHDCSQKVIYTIGMLMYYMATGKSLITSLDPHLEDSYRNNIDSNLKRIIKKCFHIDIKRRYVSVEELKKEIIIELLKISKFRKAENSEHLNDAPEVLTEFNRLTRIARHSRKRKINAALSKVSAALSTLF